MDHTGSSSVKLKYVSIVNLIDGNSSSNFEAKTSTGQFFSERLGIKICKKLDVHSKESHDIVVRKHILRVEEILVRDFNNIQIGYKKWIAKQEWAIQTSIDIAWSVAFGFAIGGFMGKFINDFQPQSAVGLPSETGFDPKGSWSFITEAQDFAGGAFVQGRLFGCMFGVNTGASSLLKSIRGKSDMVTCAASAFVSGVAYTALSDVIKPVSVDIATTRARRVFQRYISTGLFFALVQGGLFKPGWTDKFFDEVHEIKEEMHKIETRTNARLDEMKEEISGLNARFDELKEDTNARFDELLRAVQQRK